MDARSFYGSRRATKVTTIAEAYDAVENNKNVVSIVVLPPIDGDSGRKESDCEYVTSDTEDMFEPAGEIEVEEEIDSGDKLTVPLSPPKKKSRKDAPKWKKSVSSDKSLPPSRSNVAENILVLDGSTPYQTWEKIFSCSMLNHIVLQTNLYAQRDKNSPNFSLSGGDVRKFLGIILLSGYHSLPQEQYYWSTQPDLGVPAAYNTMSRKRCFAIKKFIHFADNQNLKEGDKMSRISPLHEMLNNNLIHLGIFHELLSVDESMVPYFGRHSAKSLYVGSQYVLAIKSGACVGMKATHII